MSGSDRSRLGKRILILDGILDALGRMDEINQAVGRSRDRIQARQILLAQPFGYSEIVATHILDLSVGRQTQGGIDEIRNERQQVLDRLSQLE